MKRRYERIWTVAALLALATVSFAGQVLAFEDVDRDGLPDQWETEHFGSLDQGPADDFDEDGWSNLEELINGTNPADPDGGPRPPFNE